MFKVQDVQLNTKMRPARETEADTVEALITHTPKIHDYAAIVPITHTLDHPWKGYGLKLFAHQVGGWKVL